MIIVYGNTQPYIDQLYKDNYEPIGQREITAEGPEYYALTKKISRARVKNAFEHIERSFYEKNGYLPPRNYPAYAPPVPAYHGPDYEGRILARQDAFTIKAGGFLT